jgi:ectoine hydroxylase-related dioxygenase (phytanoyl-CoA dioxygenase family)
LPEPLSSSLDSAQPKLEKNQIEQFIHSGYIVMPGLISDEIAELASSRIWSHLKVDLHDSGTWPDKVLVVASEVHEQMDICRSREIESVAAQLCGAGFHRGGGFTPVLNFPREGAEEFQTYGMHIDGIDESTLWPVKRYLVLLAYLSDTTRFGGALAVVPGSHRQAFEYWISNGSEPGGSTSPPPLDYPSPVPIEGKRGDVVFMHYLLVHASSRNHDRTIRVALNGTIMPNPVPDIYPRVGPPQPDWTALDWTLRTDNIDRTSNQPVQLQSSQ